MKKLLAVILMGLTAHAAEVPPELQVNAVPFEPPVWQFFNSENKFDQPKQVVAYEMLWPYEKRRGAASVQIGDVVVLVQIDQAGYPTKLSVLSSTDELFTRSALMALRKTRWAGASRSVCFYFKAHFDLAEIWDHPKQ
jgi:hypothetical protein